jgi:hypothetical protein
MVFGEKDNPPIPPMRLHLIGGNLRHLRIIPVGAVVRIDRVCHRPVRSGLGM